jgi:hypothetical protein
MNSNNIQEPSLLKNGKFNFNNAVCTIEREIVEVAKTEEDLKRMFGEKYNCEKIINKAVGQSLNGLRGPSGGTILETTVTKVEVVATNPEAEKGQDLGALKITVSAGEEMNPGKKHVDGRRSLPRDMHFTIVASTERQKPTVVDDFGVFGTTFCAYVPFGVEDEGVTEIKLDIIFTDRYNNKVVFDKYTISFI